MPRRETLIARSVAHAILFTKDDGDPARKPSLWARVFRLFRLYWLTFRLVRHDLFKALRGIWGIEGKGYRSSFDGKNALQTMGDMGYSGSTFFRTNDSAYLIKSIPRRFEHDFFKNDMLIPYADHVQQNPNSLLVRIMDFLESTHKSIGLLLGLAPSHHIVMENIMYGQNEETVSSSKSKWESWDLKPTSYFYPERDVAGGALASESAKSKLADEFNDKIRLSKDQADELKTLLEKDTKLLADCNAVDYSLFLVRVSAADVPNAEFQPPLEPGRAGDEPTPPAQPPFSPPGPPTWRTGIISSDGKHVYRAAVLDFFWARHAVQAKAMSGLIRGYNLIDEQGPMSITTESSEYRERFLEMCMEMVETEG